MRYQVPQFIEVEDKIFGPLTLKQFIYLIGGGGIAYMLWQFLPLYIALILIAPVAALSLGLAFYKVNNQPLITVLEYAVRYAINNKLYLWEPKKPNAKKEKVVEKTEEAVVPVPKLSQNRLKDLAWSLDIRENLNQSSNQNG
ncbi:hypothetical protein COU17_03670 [Candidatus Kaiserbacteria bacterium CG10_big_fil_rev_8_21_14_0_10_49_17]|uniref:PrgI family protein n=1 Tax=Candidatus Kaiserbacteria bacterium CG10_big_fil_rev_8_21_14_0_10_49_17 TaxID=1974609 RepID=A0A2M6WDM0_9BACT|nr:MAG: hypothetical protein COU17_03670 [Candidatus Kaiserbacteria bacterium CG10_big_fil_rev_8_21_14_0_10_49_17]